jgi:hypothetical protein
MRSVLIPVVLAIVAAAVAAAFYFFSGSTPTVPAPVATSTTPTPGATRSLPPAYSLKGQLAYYKDDQYHYYFQIPNGLTTADIARGASGTEVALADAGNNARVTIIISPTSFSGGTVSVQQILKASPSTAIENPAPVIPAPGCGGQAFDSNNEDFDGASHDIWFVCKGNLYQLSAPRSLAPLLDAVFATWTFHE